LSRKKNVIVYEQDGSIFHVMLEVLMLPADVEQVAAVVKAARLPASLSYPRLGNRASRKKDRLGLIRVIGSSMFHHRTMLKIVRRLRCNTNNKFLLTGVSSAL
jgi:hypothetical protein